MEQCVIEKVRQLVLEYKQEKKISRQVEIWLPDRMARSGEVITVADNRIEFNDPEQVWVVFVNLCPVDSMHRSCVYVMITSDGKHLASKDARTRPSGRSGILFRKDLEFSSQQANLV